MSGQILTTKEKILKESAYLIARYGFASVSMRDIANAAGIKAASIYNHFIGKDDILREIVDYYSRTRATYNVPLKEVEKWIETETVETVFRRMHFDYSPEDVEMLLNATTVVLRERYNFDYINQCYIYNFEIMPTKFVNSVYDLLVERGKMRPFDTKKTARVCVFGFNAMASEGVGKHVAALNGFTGGEPSMPISEMVDFMYAYLEKYVITDE